MAISFQFDPEARIVIATCSGSFGPDDARAGASAFWEHPEWRSLPVVWDFRDAQFDIVPEEVRTLARFVLEHQPSAPPPRLAFVTGREVDFGLARVFEAYREDPKTQVWIFRDFDEAIEWARTQVPKSTA